MVSITAKPALAVTKERAPIWFLGDMETPVL
jgi:hypothetical protein